MNPKIRVRISGFLFIPKLSKQDKIDIYSDWKSYGVLANRAAKEHGANRANLFCLITLMERHGIEILDAGYTNYSVEFKEKAIGRVLFNHEAADQVSLELGLSSRSMIYSWIREYKEGGHNVVNHKKGKPTHEGQRQTGSRVSKTSKGPRTEKPRTYCRERICKKIERLNFTKNQRPAA